MANERLWKSVQLVVSYFQTKDGEDREEPLDWTPKGAELNIAEDTNKRMTVARVVSDCGADLSIRFSQDAIGISRETITSWNGIVIKEDAVWVKNGEQWIKISGDGTITKEDGQETSIILPDGGVVHDNPARRTCISCSGAVSVIEK